MAYYTNLITAWNSVTQPPTGVTGTALTGLTTANKIIAVNAWTVVGPAVPMIIPTYAVYNLIVIAEFTALSATNQQLVRDIIGMGTVDASAGTNIRARMIAVFPNGTGTFTALSNLAKNYDTPPILWYSAPNGGALSGPVSLTDTQAAGLS